MDAQKRNLCWWLDLCWWLVGGGLLASLITAAWFVSRPPPPVPGSPEDLFSRIWVGMSQQEAVAVLKSGDWDREPCWWSKGVTKNGREFGMMGCMAFNESLPSPEEIEHAVLRVDFHDGAGPEVQVTLGRGGIVTGKRFIPPEQPESSLEYLLHLARRALGL